MGAVDLIVIWNKKILFIKRNKEPFKGFWAFPGGFLEEKEKIKHAALRELREETGIKANKNKIKFLFYADKPNRDPRGRVISFVFYLNLEEKPKLKIQRKEIKEAKWIGVKEAEKLKLAFDHKEILKKFLVIFSKYF